MDIATTVERTTGLRVRALWLLRSVWEYYLPDFPGSSTLSLIERAVAALIVIFESPPPAL